MWLWLLFGRSEGLCGQCELLVVGCGVLVAGGLVGCLVGVGCLEVDWVVAVWECGGCVAVRRFGWQGGVAVGSPRYAGHLVGGEVWKANVEVLRAVLFPGGCYRCQAVPAVTGEDWLWRGD